MRDTVVGAVLAIVFLALLFAAPRLLPRGVEAITRAEIAQISPSFSGTRYIGSWALACSGAQQSKPAAGTNKAEAIGRCRMARGYRDKNGQLILTIAFRFAGPAKSLTMIVRYPPIASKAQFLLIGLVRQTTLRLPVYGCAKAGCVAVGQLIPAAESLLLTSPQAKVYLPPMNDGRQYTIDIRLDGLAPALAGMQRAEL
jgi:invasion protein IalB